MKKDYNRMTTSDMPIDTSFTPPVEEVKEKKTVVKPKINAIGKSTAKKVSSTTKKASSTTTKKTSTSTEKKTVATEKKSVSSSTKAKAETPETNKKETDEKLHSKLSKDSVKNKDLDKLNEDNIKNYSFKSKRNKVVIVILSICLAIAVATIAIYLVISKLDANCSVQVHGVNATVYIDDQQLSEFRAPSNLRGNSILSINLKIGIDEAGSYNVKFIPKCYQKNVLMENTLIYEHNTELFYEGGDGYYYSIKPIEGNQMISICGGVILDYEYRDSLNVDSFRLEFHIYFEKEA